MLNKHLRAKATIRKPLGYDRAHTNFQHERKLQMNHQDARLIDAEQIEELDRLLEPLGESVMEVGVLDGYLTASLLAPEVPTDEDLLPFIFDEEGDPEKVPDNPRILELIDMRKREIAAALNAGGGLDPIILPFVDDEGNEILDAEGIDAIEPWATGFFMGAGVWADPILEGEDDNAFKHLARIARYAPLEADSPDDEALIERIEEAAGKKPETLADALYDVVESVFELKQYLRPNKPVRRESPRIGRNDPCPCGSGKKYKQCCGKN